MQTAIIDNKGRLALGKDFANRTVMIEQEDSAHVRITMAKLPEREAWLAKNKEANEMVDRGIEQAQAGHFVKGPDLEADRELADTIEDDI